ncbi:hypothetical protein [Xenorhabdus indica]|nr:hypothetical protein [Xenorhabdus indica]
MLLFYHLCRAVSEGTFVAAGCGAGNAGSTGGLMASSGVLGGVVLPPAVVAAARMGTGRRACLTTGHRYPRQTVSFPFSRTGEYTIGSTGSVAGCLSVTGKSHDVAGDGTGGLALSDAASQRTSLHRPVDRHIASKGRRTGSFSFMDKTGSFSVFGEGGSFLCRRLPGTGNGIHAFCQ